MKIFHFNGFWLPLCGLLFIFSPPAYAYLDPGSGSYILQILLGGVAGLVVVVKLYWNHFLAFLGVHKARRQSLPKDEQQSDSDSEA